MLCQLKGLEYSVYEISRLERIIKQLRRKIYRLQSKIFNGEDDKYKAFEKTKSTDKINKRSKYLLSPGDVVRVKSRVEIEDTLNEEGKYQKLSFTPVMWQYCGKEFVVLKRLEKVFDERKWKLSKIKNTVLLKNVYCNGAGGIEKEWDGCDRTCFIWWKEAWLERVNDTKS